jgi:Domain of unknown function (DUF4402)
LLLAAHARRVGDFTRFSAALCACVTFGIAAPAAAGSQSGSAKTAVLGPVAMLNTAPLDFGGLIPNGGGQVFINAQTAARTATGVILSGGNPRNARFIATGTANQVVTLTLSPSPIVITNGAASMSINQIRVSVNGGGPQPLGPNHNLGPLGVINFAIGGRLIVAANQAEGQYTGTFSLTMDYQ